MFGLCLIGSYNLNRPFLNDVIQSLDLLFLFETKEVLSEDLNAQWETTQNWSQFLPFFTFTFTRFLILAVKFDCL